MLAAADAMIGPCPPSTDFPFTGNDEADRLLVERAARAADRLRARPAGAAPEGVLRAARAEAPDRRRSTPRRSRRWTRRSSTRPSGRRRRCTDFPATWPAGPRSCARSSSSATAATPAEVWTEAKDGADLNARLLELPGFGPMKAGHDRRDPRQAARRHAGRLGAVRADAHDARRRRLGREAGDVPGRQAGLQGGDAGPGQARLSVVPAPCPLRV